VRNFSAVRPATSRSVYTAKAITSLPPTGARKNRALCLAASGKMRSSPSGIVFRLRISPAARSFFLSGNITAIWLSYLSRFEKKLREHI